MRNGVLLSIAIGASLSAAVGHASCSAPESETVVRGRFVRCESVDFYWDASGVDRTIQEMLDRWLAARDPSVHDRIRERWREQGMLPGMRRPQTEFVAVVRVDWQASTTPWRPNVLDAIEIKDQPREFYELVRYLWLGPPDACERTQDWPTVDLWVTYPCCDTPDQPGDDGCLMRMNSAAPAPAPMRDALSKALDGR